MAADRIEREIVINGSSRLSPTDFEGWPHELAGLRAYAEQLAS